MGNRAMETETYPLPEVQIDLAPELARPQLQALLFCDWYNRTHDGKYNLFGVFDRLTVAPPQYETPGFIVYLRVAQEGDGPVTLRVYSPDGTLALEVSYTPDAPPPPGTQSLQLLGRLQFEAEQPGRYWFEVRYREQVLGGVALTIFYEESQEAIHGP